MKLIKVESSSSVAPLVERLYIDSFPPEERRPWKDVMWLVDNNRQFEMLEVVSDNAVVGFITLWHLGSVAYGEHFAIDPSCRGGGLGGEVVEAVINRLGKTPWIIEVEPPGMTPEAQRRIGFYTRHGMILQGDFRYIQPSYGSGLPPVELKLMTSRNDVDLDEATRLIHRNVYNA